MALFEQLAAKMVADLIRDYKLQAFQAAAFPGNAGEESGGFTKLQEQNPRSGRGGLGFFQDTGPRRVAFEAWLARNADKNWSAGDYAANYSFLVRELDGPEKHVLAPLRAATTVEDATDVVMRVFERPDLRTAHLEVRVDFARKALAAFHATGQDEDELRAQPRPGAQAPEKAREGEIIVPPPHQPGAAAAQPSDILPTLIRILTVLQSLMSRMGDFSAVLGQVAAKPTTPPSKVEPTAVALGLGSFATGLFAQLHGAVAPPEGLEHFINLATSPTVTGTLTTLIPLATTALGLTGGWGALASGAMKIIGPLIVSAADAQKKKQGQ